MGQVRLSGKAGPAPVEIRIRQLHRASKTLEVFRLPFVFVIKLGHLRGQRILSVFWLCVVIYVYRG